MPSYVSVCVTVAFGTQRVKGQAGLARAGEPGDDDQLVAGNINVDIFKVVRARAPHTDVLLLQGRAERFAVGG